jgi:hypothetical protein
MKLFYITLSGRTTQNARNSIFKKTYERGTIIFLPVFLRKY